MRTMFDVNVFGLVDVTNHVVPATKCICPSEVQNEFGGRSGRNNPNKLFANDIADTIMAALNMPRNVLWPELAVFANNPWKE